jgi:hypothetical protein
MDSVSGAVSLARALLSLWRSEQSGVLHVQSELGACRLSIVRGVLRAASALPCAGDALGDGLLRDGALDARAHARALADRSAGQPVGAWLVDAGLVTRPAVAIALRRQLRARALRLLACQRIDYRFEPGALDEALPWIEEPIATPDLVLGAMRAGLSRFSRDQTAALIAPGELRLNAAGRALTRAAALWPQEAVAVALLSRGTTLERVMEASRDGKRALQLIAALDLLSALAREPLATRRFSLLLRKREQARRAVAACTLLDLPPDAAPSEARRALRRLARSLHPDALGPHAGQALRRASSEVMGALIQAERELRAGVGPRRRL